jgi:hypothetical protein
MFRGERCHDERLLTGVAHPFDEKFIVPTFTSPLRGTSMRGELMNFRHEWSIRTVRFGGCRDDGNFHQRGELCEHHGVRPQLGYANVLNGLKQTRLVI